MKKTFAVAMAVVVVVFASCGRGKSSDGTSRHVPNETPTVELKDRDFEIIEHALRQWPNPETNRVYYLTTTPKEQWGDAGNWRDLPDEFHTRIADLPIAFHKASEARLANHWVLDQKTGTNGWMQWVTIKKWISDAEVEVEQGVWTAPLGGGAQTIIYHKVDGKWEIKKTTGGWLS